MTAFVRQRSFAIFNGVSLVVVALCIAACGGQGVTRSAQPTNTPKVPGGYLATGSTYVLFLQFTKTKDIITGEWNEASTTTNTTGIQQIHTYQTSFRSPLTGVQFVLTIAGRTYTSSLDGDNIVIEFPQPNGTLTPITLQPAGVPDYNNAIINFQNAVQQENQNVADAQAAANAYATATAVTTDEQTRLHNDLSYIGGAIQQLNADIDLKSLFKSYTDNLNQMQTDYQTEQTDAKRGCPDIGQVNADANQVAADNNQTSANDNQFQADNNQILSDIQTVQDLVDKMKQHWSNLGRISPGVTQSGIDTAVNNGNTALRNAKSTMASATKQIQGYDSTSQNNLHQAQAFANAMKC